MATSHKYVSTSKVWSFGAELELADWPRHEPLRKGMAIDEAECNNVNSNGVAVDGKGKTYHLGGEILTAPSEDINGPAEQYVWIMNRWPETSINYRMGLNIHVRVPGLRDDLKKLKQLQTFSHRVMPELLPIIDPIPTLGVKTSGAKKCYNKRKKDHHTLLPKWRLELQMKARTPQEFFEAEAIHVETGKVHWAIVPRTCVNLRQLMQTDTVEFRHFFMPSSPKELLNAALWCKQFLEAAFDGSQISVQELVEGFFGVGEWVWPKCLPYDPWLDEGFYYTSPHFNPPDVAVKNIEKWLAKRKPRP